MRKKSEIEQDIADIKEAIAVTTDAEQKAMLEEGLATLQEELAGHSDGEEKPAEGKPAKEKKAKGTKGKKKGGLGKSMKDIEKEQSGQTPKKIVAPAKKSEIADKTPGKKSTTKFGNELHVKSETEYLIKFHKGEGQVAAIIWNEEKGQWDIDCCSIGGKHPKFSKGQVEEAIFWVEDFWECMETMKAKHEQVKKSRARAKKRAIAGKPSTLTVSETAKSVADKIEDKVEKAEGKEKPIAPREVKTIAKELTDAIMFSAKHSQLDKGKAKRVEQAVKSFLSAIEKILSGGGKKMEEGGSIGLTNQQVFDSGEVTDSWASDIEGSNESTDNVIEYNGAKYLVSTDSEGSVINPDDEAIIYDYAKGGKFTLSGKSEKMDRQRKAKHPGKRKSKKGNTYYEYRENRSDVNRTTKL